MSTPTREEFYSARRRLDETLQKASGTVVKPKKPLSDSKLRQMIRARAKELYNDDHPVSIDVKEFLATNPPTADLNGLLIGLQKTEFVQNLAVDAIPERPTRAGATQQQVRPQQSFKSTFSGAQAPPVTSVQRNGNIYASRRRTDVKGFNKQREVRRALSEPAQLAKLGLFGTSSVPASEPLAFPDAQPARRRNPKTLEGTSSFDTATEGEAQPQATPSAVKFANTGGTGTEADRAVQAQLEKINATVKGLGAAEVMLQGASPLDKVNLMRQLQEDANLQALVAAGMMKWSDVLMPNPARGKTGHVDGVDVGKPVINQPKLTDLRLKLAALGRQGANTELQRVAQRQRQRVTSGYKPPQRGDAFPGKRIWTGPRYMPGTVTNPQNVSS
jgi:hypothetical protein